MKHGGWNDLSRAVTIVFTLYEILSGVRRKSSLAIGEGKLFAHHSRMITTPYTTTSNDIDTI